MDLFNKTVLLFFLASTILWQGCSMNELELKSSNNVLPDKVIMKTPEEVMFSQQELETVGVALNPAIAGIKPVIRPESIGAAAQPFREARYSITNSQTSTYIDISIRQFVAIGLDEKDASIEAAKSEFENSAEKNTEFWVAQPALSVGNQRIAQAAGENAIHEQYQMTFRRNNFVVVLSMTRYGTDIPTAGQIRELGTYAVMIDNKIQ